MAIPDPSALEAFIAKEPSPAEVRAFVGQTPVVDSFSPDSKIAIAGIHLIPVPGREAHYRPFEAGDDAMYWRTSEDAQGVEIIGVVWGQGRKPRVVCGIVLPP